MESNTEEKTQMKEEEDNLPSETTPHEEAEEEKEEKKEKEEETKVAAEMASPPVSPPEIKPNTPSTPAGQTASPAPSRSPSTQRQSNKPDPAPAQGPGGGGWGGWGGWWTATSSLVSSVTESASKAANQIADQLNSALLEDEANEGEDDDPHSKGKEKVKDEEEEQEGEGLLDYLSTVLQQQVQGAEKSATSMLESTIASLNQFSLEQSVEIGQKWTMQSLDMLEAVGKKTIESLELEEQLQQTITRHLNEEEGAETKSQAQTEAKPVSVTASPKPVRQKAVTFETNFEDCYGKAHLEALEHLSASCLMIFYKANPQTVKKLAGSLKRIEKLFNEDDDEDEEQELDSKLLRRLNRKARMKRKVIEKFVAAAKQSAQQLLDEFNQSINKKDDDAPKQPQQLSEETLSQLSNTSKSAMLRLSELSAAAVELLLRIAESYLVGVTAPVVAQQSSEATDEGDEAGDVDSHDEPENQASGDAEDEETPALLVTLLTKTLLQSIEDVTQAYITTVNSIAKAGKASLQGAEDGAKLIVDIDKKVKAIKKDVESKYGSSALENLQEAKKMFLNISKAVLVNPSVLSASPSPASPSALAQPPATDHSGAVEQS